MGDGFSKYARSSRPANGCRSNHPRAVSDCRLRRSAYYPLPGDSQLPKDPGRSEVEVMLHRANALVLPEAASDTLPGIRDSTVRLVQEIIGELIGIWRRRRATPALLSQPQAQWPEGASEETTGFEGYRPGSMEYDPAAIVASPRRR